MEPTEIRVENVRRFLHDIEPSLELNITPISDPFGPSIVDPVMDAIIVSQETVKGGNAVNQERLKKGLSLLKLVSIPLTEDEESSLVTGAQWDGKVSSSHQRQNLLGTILKRPADGRKHKHGPYVIGLTGGIATGKSHIAAYLRDELGAVVLDCDKLGHQTYLPGTPTYHKIIDTFGGEVVNSETKLIDRKVLGSKVFNNKNNLSKLNGIVWPAISDLVQTEISKADGNGVVVLDAAVLIEAGWDSLVDQVWSVIIPPQIALQRLEERNPHLTKTQREDRVTSQITNADRVDQSNVIFCSLWEKAVTRRQVDKAWAILHTDILKRPQPPKAFHSNQNPINKL